MTDKEKAEEFKVRGNDAMRTENFKDALDLYSKAIELDDKNAVLYSNRSAANCKDGHYGSAISDADKAIKLRPTWGKGYSRMGVAYMFLQRWKDAIKSYKEGLKKDPDNAVLKEQLAEAEDTLRRHDTGPLPGDWMHPFHDPLAMSKLAGNPKTKHLLEDVAVRDRLRRLTIDTLLISNYMKNEDNDKVMIALGTLMCMDYEAGLVEGGFDGSWKGLPENTPPPGHGVPRDMENPYPAPKELSDTEKAEKEKEKGNEAYKIRDFQPAITHYQKAIELDPSEIKYLLNLAAVYKEQGEYQKCAETSMKAVEVGRENRADYKVIAKAFARCALAHNEMQEYDQAKNYYEKSLSEHRTPETKAKLSEVEKTIKELTERAYLDPEKAEKERERGNDLFKQGNYPDALKAYSEAIKRNPEDPKPYSNRAACYNKLAAFDLGVKDCDVCIKLDPQFIKGYIRKGVLLKGMQQFDKAMEAFQKAIELDENNAEAISGYRECMVSLDNDPDQVKKRALADPDVQKILGDPGMRLILEQMQENPHAAREHMQNPDIAIKIQKLVQCGLIAFR